MKRLLKPIIYRGHTITLVRYSSRSARNGREYGVMWNANIEGVPLTAYNVYFKRSALAMAQREIDLKIISERTAK